MDGTVEYSVNIVCTMSYVRVPKNSCFWVTVCTRRWDSERKLLYDDTFNHFYAVRSGSYRIRWNNAKYGPLRCL